MSNMPYIVLRVFHEPDCDDECPQYVFFEYTRGMFQAMIEQSLKSTVVLHPAPDYLEWRRSDTCTWVYYPHEEDFTDEMEERMDGENACIIPELPPSWQHPGYYNHAGQEGLRWDVDMPCFRVAYPKNAEGHRERVSFFWEDHLPGHVHIWTETVTLECLDRLLKEYEDGQDDN